MPDVRFRGARLPHAPGCHGSVILALKTAKGRCTPCRSARGGYRRGYSTTKPLSSEWAARFGLQRAQYGKHRELFSLIGVARRIEPNWVGPARPVVYSSPPSAQGTGHHRSASAGSLFPHLVRRRSPATGLSAGVHHGIGAEGVR